MFGKQHEVSEALKEIVKDAIRNCPNVISLTDLNNHEPEPMSTKVLLTVKS